MMLVPSIAPSHSSLSEGLETPKGTISPAKNTFLLPTSSLASAEALHGIGRKVVWVVL